MLLTIKAIVFYFSVLDQKKIQNLMREGGKKHLRNKTLNLFLKNLMSRQNKKNIWQIYRNVDEGDEIKKNFDLFKKKS